MQRPRIQATAIHDERSLSRRRALRFALGLGGAAVLATAVNGPRISRAFAQEDGEGEDAPLPQGAQQIVMPFEFTVRQGPDAGLVRIGVLTLVLEPSGAVSRGVMTNDDGAVIATVVGQITGRAVNLAFTLEDGRVLYGVGTSRGDLRLGAFELGGPLVGPAEGDAGDWVGLGESAQDTTGAIYLLDTSHHVMYRINNVGAPQALYAGVLNAPGLVNGQRLSAKFSSPSGIGIRTSDNAIFIGDVSNQAIRMVNRSTNMVSTVITGAQARAAIPGLSFVTRGVAAGGNRVYIADTNSHVILRYMPNTNQLQLHAGAVNQPGMRDGTGAVARFRNPTSISLSPDGSILNVVDSGNGLIRQITPDGFTTSLGSVNPG